MTVGHFKNDPQWYFPKILSFDSPGPEKTGFDGITIKSDGNTIRILSIFGENLRSKVKMIKILMVIPSLLMVIPSESVFLGPGESKCKIF